MTSFFKSTSSDLLWTCSKVNSSWCQLTNYPIGLFFPLYCIRGMHSSRRFLIIVSKIISLMAICFYVSSLLACCLKTLCHYYLSQPRGVAGGRCYFSGWPLYYSLCQGLSVHYYHSLSIKMRTHGVAPSAFSWFTNLGHLTARLNNDTARVFSR